MEEMEKFIFQLSAGLNGHASLHRLLSIFSSVVAGWAFGFSGPLLLSLFPTDYPHCSSGCLYFFTGPVLSVCVVCVCVRETGKSVCLKVEISVYVWLGTHIVFAPQTSPKATDPQMKGYRRAKK